MATIAAGAAPFCTCLLVRPLGAATLTLELCYALLLPLRMCTGQHGLASTCHIGNTASRVTLSVPDRDVTPSLVKHFACA